MRHTILNGDVIDCLRSLPDCSVQCAVTSPPYWGLRDYGVEGQIGLEPTPGEYVEKMIEVFREVKRVLRDDGTLWLNLGDSYASAWACGRRNVVGNGSMENGKRDSRPNRVSGDIKEKDMVGIPWRVAFALQADGWYLRSDIIWSKPNPMPESVTDRPTKSHEYVFLLSKSARYFYDADAVREGCGVWKGTDFLPTSDKDLAGNEKTSATNGSLNNRTDAVRMGRNRRTVWEIATQPTPEAHFATFPEALVEPCIKAGTSERGCCPMCGAPWRRVVEREVTGIPHYNSKSNGRTDCQYGECATTTLRATARDTKTVCWQPSCTCGDNPVPCVVLDPFGGSGTVAKVARDLGRSSISCELNPEYVKIAKKRLRIGEQLDSGVCEYVVTNLLTEG